MDQYFLKNHECVFPLDTNKPNETQCTILEKSHESTWKDVMDILHRNFCPLPCVTMTVRFAGIEFIDIPWVRLQIQILCATMS